MSDLTAENREVRVLIVDDHPIVRHGIAMLINQVDNLSVCAEAEDGRQALSAIESDAPDVVILDLTLGDVTGFDLIKDISVRHPDIPVLVLSMHDETLYAERTLRAGAKGYLMKEEAKEKVVDAVRKVHSGGVYVSEGMTEKLLTGIVSGQADRSPIERLSDRELEVFRMVGEGMGTRAIAERLNLSVKTIETYRAHIKRKLDLKDAPDLVRRAVQWVNSGATE